MKDTPSAKITGLGVYVPDKVLTNDDLAKMVDTSDEWISTRTGIKERHIASETESTSVLGAKAAKKALYDAGIPPDDIEAIIVGTGSPDMIWPSTAALIQDAIGAGKAAAFDISAACTSFVYGLEVARSLIVAGSFAKVLLVGADAITRFIDWEDRNTCVLFGDGAGAVVVESAEDGKGIFGSSLYADGSRSDILKIPAGGSAKPASARTVAEREHYIKMNGNDVFKFAVQAVAQNVTDLLDKFSVGVEDVCWFVPHQANQRIIEAAAAKLDADPAKWFSNIAAFGNTSSASIPLALDELRTKGQLAEGDLIVTIGFGAGMTWGANLMTWTLTR